MTYHYAVELTGKCYHIVQFGCNHALCGLWVKTGRFVSSAPPDGQEECKRCAKVWRRQADNARVPTP